MNEGTLEHAIRGERLLLHPSRAVLWPARRVAIVADVHFGKSTVFARHGIAVPEGADALDRERLAALLHATGSERLIVLGDFLHGAIDVSSQAAVELAAWLAALRPVRVELVTGNHDRSARAGWQPPVSWQGDELSEGPFRFVHEAAPNCGASFTFSGHVHPVVAFGGLRKRRTRLPVFWQQADGMVLPSFGLFTGGYTVTATRPQRVFVAGPDAVVELRVAAAPA